MEEHALVVRLQNSRQRLRSLLLPDPETGRIEGDAFPRSAIMQLLFNPRARRLMITVLPTLLMLFGSRRRASGSRLWPKLAQSLGALAALARR
jgi:hypothetical protein